MSSLLRIMEAQSAAFNRAPLARLRKNGSLASLRASAKQSSGLRGNLDCFVAFAPRNDDVAASGTASPRVNMDHRVEPGGDEERKCGENGSAPEDEERSSRPYCVGPSWQDCGAVGESRCQVGTSHFEQAASESPSRSEATIGRQRGMSSRLRRLPSALTLVCIRKTPRTTRPTIAQCHKTATILRHRRTCGERTEGKRRQGASVRIFRYI
jgi:hypothetical protein